MNPFEIRYAIFHTAKDILEAQYKANLASWEVMDKASKEVVDLMPKFPTMAEIINKAVEINQFVSDANVAEIKKVTKRLTM